MYRSRSNLIIGFHGCDAEVCNKLLNHPNEILKSERPYDWLGHGIYFWENNYERALLWAKDKYKRGEINKPAVIGAVLSLDYCFDLLDNQFIQMIRQSYELMVESYKIIGKELPINRDAKGDQYKDKILRDLDCSVIEFMHQKIIEIGVMDKSNAILMCFFSSGQK